MFHRLSLDLPRFTENDEFYSSLLKEAKENLERETARQDEMYGIDANKQDVAVFDSAEV